MINAANCMIEGFIFYMCCKSISEKNMDEIVIVETILLLVESVLCCVKDFVGQVLIECLGSFLPFMFCPSLTKVNLRFYDLIC